MQCTTYPQPQLTSQLSLQAWEIQDQRKINSVNPLEPFMCAQCTCICVYESVVENVKTQTDIVSDYSIFWQYNYGSYSCTKWQAQTESGRCGERSSRFLLNEIHAWKWKCAKFEYNSPEKEWKPNTVCLIYSTHTQCNFIAGTDIAPSYSIDEFCEHTNYDDWQQRLFSHISASIEFSTQKKFKIETALWWWVTGILTPIGDIAKRIAFLPHK